MSFTPLEYLRHILVECEFLTTEAQALSKADFLQNPVLQRAFVRSIEIIGEASKQLPAEFTVRHPEIDWRVMAGMRDRLIHGYFAIDYDIVWNVAAHEGLILKRKVEQILASGS